MCAYSKLFLLSMTCCAVIVEVGATVSVVKFLSNGGEGLIGNRALEARPQDTGPVKLRCDRFEQFKVGYP